MAQSPSESSSPAPAPAYGAPLTRAFFPCRRCGLNRSWFFFFRGVAVCAGCYGAMSPGERSVLVRAIEAEYWS